MLRPNACLEDEVGNLQDYALALSLGRLELKDDFGGRAVMHEDAES